MVVCQVHNPKKFARRPRRRRGFGVCWLKDLSDAGILERLVALNAERAAEEVSGVIHWLRPEYQTRNQKPEGNGFAGAQSEIEDASIANRKSAWPKTFFERVQAVEAALHRSGDAVTPAEVAKQFSRAKTEAIAEILQTLVTLGRARKIAENKFSR